MHVWPNLMMIRSSAHHLSCIRTSVRTIRWPSCKTISDSARFPGTLEGFVWLKKGVTGKSTYPCKSPLYCILRPIVRLAMAHPMQACFPLPGAPPCARSASATPTAQQAVGATFDNSELVLLRCEVLKHDSAQVLNARCAAPPSLSPAPVPPRHRPCCQKQHKILPTVLDA